MAKKGYVPDNIPCDLSDPRSVQAAQQTQTVWVDPKSNPEYTGGKKVAQEQEEQGAKKSQK